MVLSDSLSANLNQHWTQLAEFAPQALDQWQGSARDQLEKALVCSDFIASALTHTDGLLQWLYQHHRDVSREACYQPELTAALETVNDEHEFHRQLRLCRQRELVWIAWRDIHQQ